MEVDAEILTPVISWSTETNSLVLLMNLGWEIG